MGEERACSDSEGNYDCHTRQRRPGPGRLRREEDGRICDSPARLQREECLHVLASDRGGEGVSVEGRRISSQAETARDFAATRLRPHRLDLRPHDRQERATSTSGSWAWCAGTTSSTTTDRSGPRSTRGCPQTGSSVNGSSDLNAWTGSGPIPTRRSTEPTSSSKRRAPNRYPVCRGWDVDTTVKKALVDIPGDIVELKDRDLRAAQRWRMATREVFQSYFRAGFTAVALLQQAGQFRYLLLRPPSQGRPPARSLE